MEKPLPASGVQPSSNEHFVLDQNGTIVRKGDQIAVALTGLLGGFVLDINEQGVVLAIPMFMDITKPMGGLIKAHQRPYEQPAKQS